MPLVQNGYHISSAYTFEITGTDKLLSHAGNCSGESPNQVQVSVPHKTVESPNSREAAEFEVAELIAISQDKKVIVDTCIPIDILKEITDYDHVAVMLSPQSMSVERFFDRSDPEKQFLLNVIDSCDDPAAVMENYRQGLARINSKEHYDEYANSGFFTVVREDNGLDTREQVCDIIAKHFGLVE